MPKGPWLNLGSQHSPRLHHVVTVKHHFIHIFLNLLHESTVSSPDHLRFPRIFTGHLPVHQIIIMLRQKPVYSFQVNSFYRDRCRLLTKALKNIARKVIPCFRPLDFSSSTNIMKPTFFFWRILGNIFALMKNVYWGFKEWHTSWKVFEKPNRKVTFVS